MTLLSSHNPERRLAAGYCPFAVDDGRSVGGQQRSMRLYRRVVISPLAATRVYRLRAPGELR